MVALPDRPSMSAEEYLAWEPTQEERYEYWDGEVVAISGQTRNHNRITINFFKLLDDSLNLPYEIYIRDVKVQVQPGKKYFFPDLVVTCDEHDNDPQLLQFPSLIIEVYRLPQKQQIAALNLLNTANFQHCKSMSWCKLNSQE
jgi:Uma2 family endonuclease